MTDLKMLPYGTSTTTTAAKTDWGSNIFTPMSQKDIDREATRQALKKFSHKNSYIDAYPVNVLSRKFLLPRKVA